jgi:hypothetical protein
MTPHPPSGLPGDAAAFQYAQDHRSTIRRIISSRLGARLRQVFSTSDIEQSLLRSLLERPQPPKPLTDHELARVVTVIAVRLVLEKARHEHHSLWVAPVPEHERATGPADDPAEQAAARDFVETVRALAGEDWPLVEARLDGQTFPELTGLFGGTADALRMRWNRAIDRIAEQLRGPDDA